MERRLAGKTYVSYAEAREILHARMKEGSIAGGIERVWEYLSDVGGGDPQKARSVREKLIREAGLDEVTAANLVNICPASLGEVRSLIATRAPKAPVYDESFLRKIMEILEEFCSSREATTP